MLDLRDFGARNLVMADHVHPTAFGQVWIAERALDGAGGGRHGRARAPVDPDPAGGRTRAARLQGDWTYVYRRAQGAGSGASGCRGSGAPSCLSRIGT